MVSKGRGPSGDRNGARLHPEKMIRGDAHYTHTHPEKILRGEKVGNSKLTEIKVREIRQRYALGNISQEALAKEFDVTQTMIGRITRRQAWDHVD